MGEIVKLMMRQRGAMPAAGCAYALLGLADNASFLSRALLPETIAIISLEIQYKPQGLFSKNWLDFV